MKFKFLLFIFPVLLFVFGFLYTNTALASNYNLSGSVKDNSGAAIAGASLSVNDTNSDTTITDSSGNYTMSIPQGTYNVQVTPPTGSGFSPAVALNQNISSDTTLNFILVPTGSVTLSGHVYGPLNNVIANQLVTLRNNSTSVSTTSTTDSLGKYSVQVTPGSYTLQIQDQSYNVASLNVPMDYFLSATYSLTQSTILDITIPAKQVTVHVQDTSGNPASNVQLTTSPGSQSFVNNGGLNIGGNITNASGGSMYSQFGIVPPPVTDASGNATLWLIPTDSTHSYTFTAKPASGSNLAQGSLSNIEFTTDTTITITLQPTVTVSGHVISALGNPVPNTVVSLVSSTLGSSLATATTDSQGNYSLSYVPGTYIIELQPQNSNTTNISLGIPMNYLLDVPYTLSQNASVDITIPAKQITVHVQDSGGNPISNVQLTTSPGGQTFINVGGLNVANGITNASGGSNYYNSITKAPPTDSSGNTTLWLFQNDTNHKYTFTATPPTGSSYSTASLSNISIINTSSVTMTLPQSFTVSGHVYSALGLPIPNTYIILTTSTLGSSLTSTTTDSQGRYSLSYTPGNYIIELQPTNSNTTNISLGMPMNYLLDVPYSLNQNATLDITLPAKQVTVHVQDQFQQPISGVQLTTSPGGLSFINLGGLSVGGGIVNGSGGSGYYVSTTKAPPTDSSGNTTLWLFPTDTNHSYTFTATPASGSIYSTVNLSSISITGNQTELISLQYNHATPVTTATLSPVADTNGNYTDPTTVTLSATAASGYTVANKYYTLDGGSQQKYTTPFTVAGNGSHTITYWSVDNSGVPENPNTKTFTILTTYTLSGTVYNDTNQNGFQDPGETGVAGATITLNTNQTTTTDSNGNYSFTGLVPGTYTEILTVPNGNIATTTNPATISLSSSTTQNFGVAPAGPTLVTAINAGGDTQGAYLADTDYTGGSPYSSSATVDTSNVTNPAPQAVYQTVRYGNTFSYTIPGLTPNGTYTVRLHFNELYWNSAGSRVFNVAINGTQVLSNFDIYQTSGGANKAITEQFPATPDANGNVTISFTTVTDNAMVNGIELYSGTLPSPTPTPTPTPATSAIINAGGATVGSFQADNSYNGGTVYSSTASVDTSNVTSPAPQAVYQSVRYGNFTYNVSNLVPNANFLVRLHFNELYWTSAGSRVFNVAINGQQVLSNFDIFQAAGGANKAVVEDFVRSSDSTGKISIQFITVTDNADVSGIEIVPATVPTPTYFTANNGTDFARLTSPFVSGVATQAVNADSSIALNVTNTSTYADSGFVLYEGTLGNLSNFTTVGTGNGYGLNLWLDTSNNNEFFAWDSNGILTGLGGDTYGLSNGSQNGVENINGTTNFFLMSDGQNHTLADLKNGVVPGIDANTKVAVWLGVNTSSGSTSSTIQSVNGF